MKNDKAEIPFQIMALTIPAAEAAVGKNWLPTLILALASFLLCSWMSVRESPDWKWLHVLRSVTLVLILSWGLDWTHQCWPGSGASFVVPGVLTLLAIYAVWRKSGASACSILRYGMYLILLILGILGLSQVKLADLRPTAQFPDMNLAVILLLPVLGRKNGKWKYSTAGIVAVAASILTVGSASLYDYSRGLSMSGVTEHMESLAACSITVGYFAFVCYLLDGVAQEWEKPWTILIAGIAAYGIYLTGLTIRAEAYAALILALWVIIPAFGAVKKNMKKKEKRA